MLVALAAVAAAGSAGARGLSPSTVLGHPFLLVRSTDFGELQARAAQSPWKEMKARAIADVTTFTYDKTAPIQTKSARLRDIVSAGALASILDSANKSTYTSKVVATLSKWDDLYPGLNCASWYATVPPGYAFFNSVLAMDVLYSDLTESERSSLEAKLDKVANWFWTNDCGWKPNTYAARGIWALYQGDQPKADQAKIAYKSSYLNELTANGVYSQGPGYAWGRLGIDNDGKAYFMDVLEHAGQDAYYADPRFRPFNEWLFGGSLTPIPFTRVTFGNTQAELPTSSFVHPASLRAYRFSDRAARNAAWFVKTPNPRGRLLPYVLMGQPLGPAEKPKSFIWADGGAAFWENSSSDRSLMGALWNPKSSGGHSHFDVNALHLTAYGENALRNVGYAGWQAGCAGFSWEYVYNTAAANNVALINGANHAAKSGGGIIEGLTTGALDYARGDSASALSNGKHYRNFVMLHPQDGAQGYFVTFDELTAAQGASVNLAHHPDSAAVATTLSDTQYDWTVNRYSGHDVGLSILLGTPPSSVALKDGALCTNVSGSQSTVGKYLYPTYPIFNKKATVTKNIVTVFFPYDNTHPKASLSRISGSGYTGAKVSHGSAGTDVALETSITTRLTYAGTTLRATEAIYRRDSASRLKFYFLRDGNHFNDGATIRNGMDSSTRVTLFVKGRWGSVVSPGSDVTFYYPGVKGIALNGVSQSLLASAANSVTVRVPKGKHNFELLVY